MEEIFEPVPMLFGFEDKIQFALNGAKLEGVEVSEEPNVLPEGSLHKNKHDDFGLDTTTKGIPVISLDTDDVESLSEILQRSNSLLQHAEIEESEWLFSKQTTDFLELKRKEYHESNDPGILLEVGKRLTAELLDNTDDNSGLLEKMLEELK